MIITGIQFKGTSESKEKVWRNTYSKDVDKLPWNTPLWDKLSSQCVDGFIKDNKIKILEYGFGSGHLASHLAAKGNDIYGAELSISAIKNMEKENIFNKFFHVEHPNQIKGESFDAITCMGILHHIDPSQYDAFLRSFEKLLKNNGKIVIAAWDKTDAKFAGASSLKSIYSGELTYPVNHPKNSIEKYMAKNNLKIVETGTIKYEEPNYEPTRTLRYYYIEKSGN